MTNIDTMLLHALGELRSEHVSDMDDRIIQIVTKCAAYCLFARFNNKPISIMYIPKNTLIIAGAWQTSTQNLAYGLAGLGYALGMDLYEITSLFFSSSTAHQFFVTEIKDTNDTSISK